MGQILAIDYGSKRTGIAVTDNLKLIASGLTTVDTPKLKEFIITYLTKEKVDIVVIGEPINLSGELSEIEHQIRRFIHFLTTKFPDLTIERQDERFTSKMAFQSMIDGGLKKKQRQDKAMIDKVSATLILQAFMERIG